MRDVGQTMMTKQMSRCHGGGLGGEIATGLDPLIDSKNRRGLVILAVHFLGLIPLCSIKQIRLHNAYSFARSGVYGGYSLYSLCIYGSQGSAMGASRCGFEVVFRRRPKWLGAVDAF
jgi:hypothetical protein